MRSLLATAAVLALLAPSRAPTRAVEGYQPPVDAPVVDLFRPPATPFGPGNRGIDYATTPGTPVRAAAPGEVAFAGSVGGGLHVVVRHADGIRTSYSFLAAVGVRRGEWVAAGQTVGVAASSLHFGARRGDAYIDPLTLLGGSNGRRVHLVPDGGPAHSPAAVPGAPERPKPAPVPAGAADWARRVGPPGPPVHEVGP